MLIVVAILSVIAAIAVPSSEPALREKLSLAGSLTADAFRFARDEAAHTGVVHGVFADKAGNKLQVFRLNEVPIVNVAELDVRHPVSKQLYIVQLDDGMLSGVSIQSLAGTPVGVCTATQYVGIDPTGAVICIEPTTSRIEDVSLTLEYDGIEKSVEIDSFSGRITVQ